MELAPGLAAVLAVIAWMLLWYGICLRARNYGLVDIAWGPGAAIAGWAAVLAAPGAASALTVGVVAMATLWGGRLGIHLARRNLGHPEDFRYAAMRESWGAHHARTALVRVFGLQGVIMLVMALPLIAAAYLPADHELGAAGVWLARAGVALWFAGFVIEVVADRQLARFTARPRAERPRFLDTGLWAWSRHPNYLGEALVWWGIALAALAAPWGWVGIISALGITLLLRFVSGVPLIERRWATDPAWPDHIARVPNAMWLHPPRRR